MLIASLLKRGTLLFADQLQRVEFLPSDIDNVYGFPLRSALARNDISTGGHKLFGDINIPFLYERQYFDGYDITTNLKWMGDITSHASSCASSCCSSRPRCCLRTAT